MSEGGCKACRGPLYSVGSFFACRDAGCERYATPVDAEGRTVEEAHQDAIKPLVSDEGAESEDEMDFPCCPRCDREFEKGVWRQATGADWCIHCMWGAGRAEELNDDDAYVLGEWKADGRAYV